MVWVPDEIYQKEVEEWEQAAREAEERLAAHRHTAEVSRDPSLSAPEPPVAIASSPPSLSTSPYALYIRYHASNCTPAIKSLGPWFCVVGQYPPHLFQLRNWLRDPKFHGQLTLDLRCFRGLEIRGSFTDVAATLHVSVIWKPSELQIDQQQLQKDRETLRDAMQGLFDKYNRKFRSKPKTPWSVRPPIVPHKIIKCRTGKQQAWFDGITEEVHLSSGPPIPQYKRKSIARQ